VDSQDQGLPPDDRWARRKVLVTGAGGFIGSHLVEHLVRAGAEVRAMVRYNGRSEIGALGALDEQSLHSVEIIYSDVTDPFAVRRAVAGVDVVFHLAALIAIPYSYVAPASYTLTNVIGTLNVVEAVRELAIPRMIQTSTSEVYGTARYVPIDESHPLQAQSPYSASKIGADAVAEAFHRAFGTPVATIRPFNTYGPRQSARAVIPTIAAQVVAGRDRVVLGDLRPIRDLTYVEDTVRAFMRIADADACVGQVTNVGSGGGVTIGELAHLIAEIAGRSGIEIVEDSARIRPPESEVMELVADTSRARRLMDWEPSVSLRDGLAGTIEYVAANLARYDVDRYTT
jgi:NAD dependent epimerase/dehydratase